MIVDWKEFILTFTVEDTKVVLKGDPLLSRMKVSLKMLVKVWQANDQGFFIDCQAMEIPKVDH